MWSASYTVEVTSTVEVDVVGLMDKKEEQNGVASCSFKIFTMVTTLEHCAGDRSRFSTS